MIDYGGRMYLGVEGGYVVEPVDGLAGGDEIDAGICQLLQVHVRTDPGTNGLTINYQKSLK